jgi:putative flippase GtrA
MINIFLSRQFFVFIITGGTAAIINFASRLFFNQFMAFSLAILAAYITGMSVAFVLAKIFVFKESSRSFPRSALYFGLVNLFAASQTWIISMGMALYVLPAWGIALFAKEIAHGIGILVPVFTSFLGHKYLSFR